MDSGLMGNHNFLKILKESAKVDPRSKEQIQKDEQERLKSLRITQDKRYRQMDYYRQNANNKKEFTAEGLQVGSLAFGEDATYEDIAKQEVEQPVEPSEREERKKVGGVEQRKEWQECLDKSVRQLMIDFQLTDVPTTRLAHLDRMHSWFTDHGARQVRKVVAGPNFLTAERDETLPPGSTKHLPSASGTSLQLAGVYATRTPRPGTSSSSSRPATRA